MGSHSITCHPAEVTFPPLPQPVKAVNQFPIFSVLVLHLFRKYYWTRVHLGWMSSCNPAISVKALKVTQSTDSNHSSSTANLLIETNIAPLMPPLQCWIHGIPSWNFTSSFGECSLSTKWWQYSQTKLIDLGSESTFRSLLYTYTCPLLLLLSCKGGTRFTVTVSRPRPCSNGCLWSPSISVIGCND